MLQNYFRSGWAFLIPYLAAYLLYAWLKWPVNPVAAGSSTVGGGQLAVSAIGALPSTVTPPTAYSLLSTGVPCLLHVYWFLHALHLVLGALALRAWWRESGATVAGATDDSENTANRAAPSLLSTVSLSDNRSPSTVPLRGHRPPSAMDRLWAAMPWLLLALLFYIPGVYLEWPSDPWEHLRRINEWRVLDTVTAHSSWVKSSYFIPYSLLSWATGLRQIFWLDFYYTGICLLLCWQYYRLARACDLGERASMVFVLLQALLFGNNIFSFYRYYGISSSIYAQLGAVALTRFALEVAKNPQLSLSLFFSLPTTDHRLPPSGPPSTVNPPTVYGLLLTGIPLLALIAFNHTQGLGIAGLAVGAVIVWRLIEWRRSMIWWLSLIGVLSACAACAWLPRHALLDKVYQPSGWLNYWYGFNLLWPFSPAFERAYMILGGVGLLNLTLALALTRRGQVTGWLTIFPLLALLHPAIAIPLSNFLAADGADNIIIFHRLLFSIPTTLPLIVFIAKYTEQTPPPHIYTNNIKPSSYSCTAKFFGCLIPVISAICFLSLIVFPKNRLWHSVYKVPDDLAMLRVLEDTHRLASTKTKSQQHLLLGSACLSFIYDTQDFQLSPYSPYAPPRLYRHPIARAPTDDLWVIERYIVTHSKQRPLLILAPNPTVLFTANSISATLSNQWLPQETALAFAGAAQIRRAAEYHGLSIATRNSAIFFQPMVR